MAGRCCRWTTTSCCPAPTSSARLPAGAWRPAPWWATTRGSSRARRSSSGGRGAAAEGRRGSAALLLALAAGDGGGSRLVSAGAVSPTSAAHLCHLAPPGPPSPPALPQVLHRASDVQRGADGRRLHRHLDRLPCLLGRRGSAGPRNRYAVRPLLGCCCWKPATLRPRPCASPLPPASQRPRSCPPPRSEPSTLDLVAAFPGWCFASRRASRST